MSAQATIDARQGLLKVVAQYFGPIVGIAKVKFLTMRR